MVCKALLNFIISTLKPGGWMHCCIYLSNSNKQSTNGILFGGTRKKMLLRYF